MGLHWSLSTKIICRWTTSVSKIISLFQLKELKCQFRTQRVVTKWRNSVKCNARLWNVWLTAWCSPAETVVKKCWPSESSDKPSKSSIWWPAEIPSTFSAKPSWKEEPEKIQPESEKEEPSENKLLMFHPWEELDKHFIIWHLEQETLPWKTIRALLSVWLTKLWIAKKNPLTLMPSKKKTKSKRSPKETDDKLSDLIIFFYYGNFKFI